MSVEMRCRLMSWGEVYTLSKHMALDAKASGFRPDVVVGISRGGVVPARIACDILGVTDLLTLKVEHWLQTGKPSDHALIKHPIQASLEHKSVLVVDDITDTGDSLKVAVDHCLSLKPASVKTAVMQKLAQSTYQPNFTGSVEKEWTWFIYPWNIYEDLRNLTLKLAKNHPEIRFEPEELQRGFRKYFGVRVSKKKLKEVLQIIKDSNTRGDGARIQTTS